MKRLSLLLMLLLTCGCSRPIVDRTVHLIPAGYVGEVYILHNIADGVPVKREGSTFVYEIPADGVLRSQSPVGNGYLFRDSYFFVNSRGERTPVPDVEYSTIPDTPENRADNTLVIYYPRTGTFHDNEKNCAVHYDAYYVDSKSNILTHYVEKGLSDYLDQHPVCK